MPILLSQNGETGSSVTPRAGVVGRHAWVHPTVTPRTSVVSAPVWNVSTADAAETDWDVRHAALNQSNYRYFQDF